MTSQYPDVNDIQFAGLLQVATAAADAQERHATALGKRKRNDETLIDHQLRTQHGEEHVQSAPPPTQPTLRSAAAVIFREPSEKCHKYSRPPLGKVFTDLELAPEPFLRLQTAAKAFMLDSNYPERKAVVGQKKESGNNDVAKLRLWTCVEQFLETDHNGEKYFGPGAISTAPGSPQRTIFWPQDRDRIVKLCMPLFRKMVTNERQRLYASETRKQDTTKQDRRKKRVNALSETESPGPLTVVTVHGVAVTDTSGPADDAHHDRWNYSPLTPPQSTEQSLTVHINVVSKESGNKVRRVPRISVLSDEVLDLMALYSTIQHHFDLAPYRQEGADGIPTLPCLQVLTDEALLHMYTDEDWANTLHRTRSCEWLDREVRVVLEL